MKILVTGANGMVARAVIEYCRTLGDEIVALTRQQLDISNRKAVFDLFESTKVEAVVNCAAYTNVDGAEAHQSTCFKANTIGVENLARAAKKIESSFVTISTDYVFDGKKTDFYTQHDTPNPLSIYAKSKLEGEMLARNAYSRSIIVRAGWIFGKGETNFLSILHSLLANGQSIKAIRDSYGTPTYAADLAKRLRELIELDLPCVYHVTNSGLGASYEEFARRVCVIKGFDENLLESVSVNDLKRPAPRPVSSKLACLFSEKFGLAPLQHWEEALKEFLTDRSTQQRMQKKPAATASR